MAALPISTQLFFMKRLLLIVALASALAFGTMAHEFVRHKHLVEHVTSQGCAYCPWGDHVLELLGEMRSDIARVSIHGNQGASDVFRTFKSTALIGFLGAVSMPTACFDRTPCEGEFMQVVSAYPADQQAKAEFFSDQLDNNITTPVLADVVIDAVYNDTTRMLKVLVTGDVTDDFQSTFGNDVTLTVYLIEDSLVARQLNGTEWVEDFVHNNVFRDAMSNYQGDALKWNEAATHYANDYALTLKTAWSVQNMSVIAFVSRNTTAHRNVINCQMLQLRDLMQQPIVGDINGDGLVDIADVNAVINMMLGKVDKVDAADINSDSKVDISDVNSVINIMLGK